VQKLKVNEIFYSLQGESSYIGLPTIFIRLTGCPMRCGYCDTAYAFNVGDNFTINHIHSSFVENAHYTSLNFKHDQSEFDYCNLESFYIDNYSAPFVKESKVKIGLKLNEIIPIKSNGCKFIIGEVEHILIDDSIHLINEGSINLDESNSVGVGGLNSYYTMNKITELPFPRLSTTPASEMNEFWKSKS
jgi:hypothetical protein